MGVSSEGTRKGSFRLDIFLIKYCWFILIPKNFSISLRLYVYHSLVVKLFLGVNNLATLGKRIYPIISLLKILSFFKKYSCLS